MAARVPSLSSVLLEPTPTAAGVEAVLAALRAEHDVATEGRERARLLSTLAAVSEARGDLASAARDALAATNADPALLEPLEALIGIARRRRSQKNLDKLVLRLTQVARSGAERQRAAFELAARHRAAGLSELAQQALERSLAEVPDDAAAWLALELLASHVGNPALRERALTGRVGATHDARWRALLLSDCARLRADAGDVDASLSLLHQSADEHLLLRTLEHWERTGAQANRPAEAREANEAIASLLERAREDADFAERHGVPEAFCTPERASAAWLRASVWARREGDLVRSAELARNGARLAPEEMLFDVVRLLDAPDVSSREQALRSLAERMPPGRAAAALWLELFDAAVAREDGNAAREALEQARAADPSALRARALELELLEARPCGAEYSQALVDEADASGRASALAFAALVSVLDAESTGDADVRRAAGQSAKELLDSSRRAGGSALQSAELGRILAARIGDGAWHEQATEELLPYVTQQERGDLLHELARAKLLRGDVTGAERVLASLDPSTLLAAALQAFVLPHFEEEHGRAEPPADGPTRWEAALRRTHHEAALGASDRALLGAALLGAWRQLDHVSEQSGGSASVNAAEVKLRALHEEWPESAAVTAALSDLLAPSDPAAAALVLSRSAELQTDDSLAAAWHLRASVLSWRTAQRANALAQAQKASERVPAAARPWLAWLQKALGGPASSTPDSEEALSSFAKAERAAARLDAGHYEVPELGAGDEAAAWLAALASPHLVAAAVRPESHPRDREWWAHLEASASLPRGTSAALAYASALAARGESPSTEEALICAKRWALEGGGLDGALAWLTEAEAQRNATESARARAALGELLAAPELTSSGALLDRLNLELTEPSLSPPAPARDGASSAALRWARLELSPLGGEAETRLQALTELAAPTGTDDAGAEEASRGVLLGLAAFQHLALGHTREAAEEFRRLAGQLPDLFPWEGLREAALASRDDAGEAEACAELAKRVSSDVEGAALWEQAGVLLQDRLGDAERAEAAFAAALARDYGRDTAFERLFRLVRARGDRERLLELVEGRLGVTDESSRLHELLWEKARLLRELNQPAAASQVLDALLAHEPEHLRALALASELHLAEGRPEHAVELLARLSEHPDAPSHQRVLASLVAADLFEEHLGNPRRALAVLGALIDAGVADLQDHLALVERRAFAATRAGEWQEARAAFEELHGASLDDETRHRAASFLLAISRDQLHAPEEALRAALLALDERPDDADAVAYLLASGASKDELAERLERARDACSTQLRQEPFDEPRLRLLLRIAEALDDRLIQLVALGALSTLGVLAEPERRHLMRLSAALSSEPRAELDPQDFASLARTSLQLSVSPRALEGARRLAVSWTSPESSLETLGASPSARLDPGHPLYLALTPWANAVGLRAFELLVGADDDAVHALALAQPTLVVGSALRPPFTPRQRAAVTMGLYALSRGLTALVNSPSGQAAPLLNAAAYAVGVPPPEDTSLVTPGLPQPLELEHDLREELSVAWSDLGADELPRLSAAAQLEVQAFGAVATSDPSVVLSLAHSSDDDPHYAAAARALFAFALSPELARLRDALGLTPSRGESHE